MLVILAKSSTQATGFLFVDADTNAAALCKRTGFTAHVALPYRSVDFGCCNKNFNAAVEKYGKALCTAKDKEATPAERKAARQVILECERELARLAA